MRIFFGNAGPNAVSSFHVIGEIFDKVHPEGATETLSNVQSTLVPAGGATIVVITHDRDLAARLPRQVEMLDGRIVTDTGEPPAPGLSSDTLEGARE